MNKNVMEMDANAHLNKIYTITTEGCNSCSTLNKLMLEAIKISGTKAEYVTEDVTKADKKFIKQYNVTDFPTTFLINNDKVKFMFAGTRPAIVIARWIELNL